jgi:hypothetical protein
MTANIPPSNIQEPRSSLAPSSNPATFTTHIIQAARTLAIRIKTTKSDLTIISAHSPGEHHSHDDKHRFWTALTQYLRNLPKRTTRILGIDANGHTDPQQTQPARTNTNGNNLKDLASANQLQILNNLQACSNRGHTWMTRNKQVKNKIKEHF